VGGQRRLVDDAPDLMAQPSERGLQLPGWLAEPLEPRLRTFPLQWRNCIVRIDLAHTDSTSQNTAFTNLLGWVGVA
jgi:hypothetical protein